MANGNLSGAKKARQDEFYTLWVDIEREMNAYLEYNPDVFQGKTVLLPCDDPEWSNFTKYFALHFSNLGLKKLISTSYAPVSNFHGIFYEPTLFETESPLYDEDLSQVRGRKFVLMPDDVSGDGVVNVDDLTWDYLEGDGDFRSDELAALRDEADIIVTNPPFSLFREFVAWLMEGEKQFSIIGNVNAITYKETFPLIQDNRMWVGATHFNTGMYFRVPDQFEYAKTYKFEREQDGVPVARVAGVCWFTNIEHGRRHKPLQLMTMAENKKFSSHQEVRGVGYEQYDNYDAIEVPYVDAIPSDHDGVMGVPITFLNKYNPDQFEIVGGSTDGYSAAALGVTPLGPEYVGNVGRTKLGLASTKRAVYKRILIRRKDTT